MLFVIFRNIYKGQRVYLACVEPQFVKKPPSVIFLLSNIPLARRGIDFYVISIVSDFFLEK